MAILPIRIYPDPVLRVRCAPVEAFDDALSRLVENMVETMIAAPGIGLAAPQVGVERQLALVDLSCGQEPDALHVLINPRIVEQEGPFFDALTFFPRLTRELLEENLVALRSIYEEQRRAISLAMQEADAPIAELRALLHPSAPIIPGRIGV